LLIVNWAAACVAAFPFIQSNALNRKVGRTQWHAGIAGEL
jgi:hypothetical protein